MIETKVLAAGADRAEPDKKQVWECLERILGSPVFQGSRRCREMLHYMVVKRLEGDLSALKERVIGAELFARSIDYDTSNDAIVRVKANELRKRLAIYYGERGRHDPLRIELPIGSYIPVFRSVDEEGEAAHFHAVLPPDTGQQEAPGFPRFKQADRRRLLIPAVLGIAMLVAVAWLPLRPASEAFETFWEPISEAKDPVLLCIPGRERWFFDPPVTRALEEAAKRGAMRLDLQLAPGNVAVVPHSSMSVQNFRAILQLAAQLSRLKVEADVRLVSEVSADAIRRHNAILVGAYHNPWAMQLSEGMRFTFESAGAGSQEVCWIRDREAKGEPKWKVAQLWPYGPQQVDYAIISRAILRETRQTFITMAGLNSFGTLAAAEFLTTPHYWDELSRWMKPGWEKRNCQIVLETRVVRELPGPPRILAVHEW